MSPMDPEPEGSGQHAEEGGPQEARGTASDSGTAGETGRAPTSGRGSGGGGSGVPDDLADCLKALATALQARGMYPEGHPARNAAAVRLLGALEDVLDRRSTLVVRGHRTHLSVDGNEFGTGNRLLEGLARRMHGHRLLAVEFEAGLDDQGLYGFLDALAREPNREGAPLGGSPSGPPEWPGVQLRPLSYDPLRLHHEGEDEEDSDRDLPASFEATLAGVDLLVYEPEAVVEEMKERLAAADLEREEEIVERLLRLLEAARRTEGTEARELRRRLSRTILALDEEARVRLLELTRETGEEARLLLAAADTVDVQAVAALVRAAAEGHEGGMADWLVRLLSKLTAHETGPVGPAGEDERREVREIVARILEGWGIEIPPPEPFPDELDDVAWRTSRNGGARGEPLELTVEPERVLMIGLEIDEAAPAVRESAEEMLGAGRFEELTDLLQHTPEENRVGRLLWGQLSVPEVIESLLEEHPPRFDLLHRIVIRSGGDVAPVLLDALTGPRGKSQEFRQRITEVLTEIGGPVVSLVPPLLSDPRWHARRNLLGVLRELPTWPEGFRAVSHMRDEDTRVRAEAFRAARQRPEERREALLEALEDEDPRVVGLAFEAALEDGAVPPEAEDRAVDLVRDAEAPEGVRLRSVEVLGELATAAGRDALVDVVWKRTWWFWRRIAAKTPLVLGALRTLARTWPDAEAVGPVLKAAASSKDPEIREAVDVGKETG